MMPQDPPQDTSFWEKAKRRAALRAKTQPKPPLFVLDPQTLKYRRAYSVDSTTGQPRFEPPTEVRPPGRETLGSIRARMRKAK